MADPPAGCARTTGAVVGEHPSGPQPTNRPLPLRRHGLRGPLVCRS
jgi:hypothetical protein